MRWNLGRVLCRDAAVTSFSLQAQPDMRHNGFANLQQYYVEKFLVEALQREPLAELRWLNEVVAVRPTEDHVALDVTTPEGAYTTRAQWILVHLDYIGRQGKLPLEDDEGRTHQGRNAARELASDWQLELCKGQYKSKPRKGQTDSRPKVAHNIVLSMPQGTPSDKLLTTVRAFARTNFGQRHRYAMTLHVDQAHPHVHLVVKSEQEYEPTKRLLPSRSQP